jgi:cytochrome c-type biogenesis protein CcsB
LVEALMSQMWADISDLAFEAALAAYIVALVCYAIELASRRAVNPAEAVAVGRSAAGASTLVRAGGPLDPAAIGRVESAPVAPWGVRFGRAAVVVTVVGAAANAASIVARGLAVGRLPLGNMYEFVSMICAAATITWLIVLTRTGARTLGTFVMTPIVILAVVAGTKLYVPAAPVVPALNSYWKWIHVTSVSISSSILMISGAASVGYLLRGRLERSGRLAAKGPVVAEDRHGDAAESDGSAVPMRSRSLLSVLPSMVTLDRIAYRTAIVGFPLFTFAVIAGAMWAEVAWGRYWGWDPKETCSFVTWVCYAAYLHARSTAGWRGRRAAWICVLGFASMIFNLFFINMVVSGLHSYAGLN